MAPLRNRTGKSNTGKSAAIPNFLVQRQSKRNIRQFTARRLAKVSVFMEKFVRNAEEYGRFGTEQWMKALITEMDEPIRYGLITDDVKHWICTEHYFLKWAMEHTDDGISRRRHIPGRVLHNAEIDDVVVPQKRMKHNQIVKKEVNQGAQDLPNAIIKIEAGEEGVAIQPRSATVGAVVEETSTGEPSSSLSLIHKMAHLSISSEGMQKAMINYSLETPEYLPIILSSLPPETSGSSVPHLVRRLQYHSAIMLDIVNDLRNTDCTAVNVEACSNAVDILQILLAQVGL